MTDHAPSYYAASAIPFPALPSLSGDCDTDICIVGGGFTGVSAALHLAEAGYRVVLLEAHQIGWGASGRNGGQMCPGHNKGHDELIPMVGKDCADQLWQSSVDAVELVKQLVTRYQIDCHLTPGVLHAANKAKHAKAMQEEADYHHQVLNYDAVDYLDAPQMTEQLGNDYYQGGLLFRDGAHVHPLNFVLGMAHAASGHGAQLFEHSPVLSYEDGATPSVTTAHGKVRCKAILLACNGYLGKLHQPSARRIMPINNFIIATEPLPQEVADRINPNRVAVADSKFVVNYFRLSEDRRMLWGGGENYSPNFPKDIARFVQPHMTEVYPELADYKIDYAWGGTLAITLNRMPDIRRDSANLFVAQGYSGHGVALATYAGAIFAKAVQGSMEKMDVFARIPMRDFPGGTLLRWPGLVAGMLYYAMLDRLP